MQIKYPLDPLIKHHFIIGISLGLWVFLFLYFTEPLDINEFNNNEKLKFLPIYSLIATISYIIFIPLQYLFNTKYSKRWLLQHEILFLFSLSLIAILLARFVYLYIVVKNQPNPHSFGYMLKALFLPALAIILPIIIIGRYAFGKYYEKQIEDIKIEIQGEGNYESLKLHLNDLIAVNSSDNYIVVLYISGNVLKKSIIRNTLSYIETNFTKLQRTHRSYIINPYHFQSWEISKGKHFLILSHGIKVPVSKTYLQTVKNTLNFTTA
ncbi:LytTR family DNA-binding domain-containing protein [Lacinutrix sp. 5H-3-7-4]|uniref:LytTR family DNA-binding domain-containing protein n=1 Tax=Lacinutrix sp. (strain 5H-3-7-4) TaxID=983544 RepID=UPI00020A3556|nr:LytTR family DNA-binding domain-containing protein [Lacinutrix sp. 5H-3-7-4]AEH02282.1 LytTr DNA-binding region [Lacinutrix sp. 5H-3-7-4]